MPRGYSVIAITRDEAIIWRDISPSQEDFALAPIRIHPPIEVDHRHRRTGQSHHGHDTDHKFPEYFEEIADQMRTAEGVLIIGHGKGKASYAKSLMDHLEKKEPLLLAKVMDVTTFDLVSKSEAEVRAHAREWFAKNFRNLSSWHERTPDRRFT